MVVFDYVAECLAVDVVEWYWFLFYIRFIWYYCKDYGNCAAFDYRLYCGVIGVVCVLFAVAFYECYWCDIVVEYGKCNCNSFQDFFMIK